MDTLTVDGPALSAALDKLKGIVEKRNTIPILSNVLLRGSGDGSLTLMVTNMDTWVEVTVPATGAPINTTAPYMEFRKCLPLSDEAEVMIGTDGNHLKITRGAFTGSLPTQPASDLPMPKAYEFDARFSVSGGPLLRALERVRDAISVEETQYYLNGVFICPHNDVLTLVATDGHRLIKETLDAAIPVGWAGVIIPRVAIGSLVRLLADHSGDVLFELDSKSLGARIMVGNAVLTTKAIDGTFPDVWKVIPAMDKAIATLDVDSVDLINAVRPLKEMGERSSPIRFDLGAETRVSMKVAGDATFELSVPAIYTGKANHLGFQARYLIEALSYVVGPVRFHFTGWASNPTLVTAQSLPGWQAVLMPIKVW